MQPYRTPWSLALACFASMASMRICDAMLPALGKSLGGTPSEASRVISSFALAYGLSQVLYGALGDRVGKERVIAFGALLAATAAIAAALSPTLGWLVAARAAMGGGAAAIVPLTMAAIADRVPPEDRHAALASLLTFTIAGMMAGTWAGGAIADSLGWRAAFVLTGFLLGTAGLALALGARGAREHVHPSTASFSSRVRDILGSAWSRRVLAIACIEGGLVFGVMAFIPSLLHQRFDISLSAAGAVLALYGAGGLVYSRLAPRLLRWLPPSRLALSGAALLCLSFMALVAVPHWLGALPACLFAGIGFYMLHNTLQACATHMSAAAKGTAMSLFASSLFIGQSLGVVAMGWAVERQASVAAILAAGTLLFLLVGWFGTSVLSETAPDGAALEH